MASGGGEEVIAASRRPDGTWRKERRVKAGYTPPDEMDKYESKGKRFMNDKPSLPPGYVPSVDQSKPLTKNQKKNQRKKEKRKEKDGEECTVAKVTEDLSKTSLQSQSTQESTVKDNTELLKKIKGLRKKVKQIEQLEERKSKGEELEREQLEKIQKKIDFINELEDLELQLE